MKELPKAYEPKAYEDNIYQKWEESGYFNPDVCIEKGITEPDAEPFSIVLPPPNVTGTLHIGHAVMLAIEDVMVRYHRMKGDRTLWVPGTDHAAIATQEKVERILWDEEKKTRHDLGREKFLEKVEQFAQDSHDRIVNQAKKMGTSMDWSREYYSLDEKRNAAVNQAFKKMYDDGLIYRGDRIVNWDPKMQSNVSNIEVVRKDEKAKFYYFQYGPFEIGTARPETKFGDKYVVMHPDDKRYAEYKHGDTFECEWINGSITATVIKDSAVDPEFGSGVMTITPWHDATDFFIAERHDLEKQQVIDLDGKLLPIAGEFAGMKIEDAREKIVEKLNKKGLLTRVEEDYVHSAATNSRGGGVIEPQIMKQWWVDVNAEFRMQNAELRDANGGEKTTLKKVLQHVVREKKIDILPERFEKNYFNWVDNLLDWCLSRQIWYGHRVPAWYKKLEKPLTITLIRHGESEANVKKIGAGHMDSPLTENGRAQATDMGSQLTSEKFDAIYSSDLVRASETAKIAFASHEQEVMRDSRLREVDFGDLTGKSGDEINVHRVTGFPGGETYEQVRDRMVSLLNELQEKHPGGHIAFVGHSGTWKILEHIANGKRLDENLLFSHAERKPFTYSISSLTHVGANAPEGDGWEQDSDTLDTWFSAGMFSFSPLGDIDQQDGDIATYHPTNVLETGYDILTFWVIRMILMTTYLREEIPFKTVYLHGLVRDDQGRKMSKSLGNIIDPLDVSEKFGTDAVRLSLMVGATPGNDSKLSEEKIGSYRNFANKLWNISRFTLMNIDEPKKNIGVPTGATLADKWILARTEQVVQEVTEHLEAYRFSPAAELLRDFTWNELADWYLEIAKVESAFAKATEDKGQKQEILNFVLNTVLKLWHPYMPFVTEAIWQEVYGEDEMLMVEKWPDYATSSSGMPDSTTSVNMPESVAQFVLLQEVVTSIRSLRAEKKIDAGKKLTVVISCEKEQSLLDENAAVIRGLARVGSLTIAGKDAEKPEQASSAVVGGVTIYLDLAGAVDVEAEKARLQKEIDHVSPFVTSLEKKLGNAGFVDNAPEAVLIAEKKKLADAKEKLVILQEELSKL